MQQQVSYQQYQQLAQQQGRFTQLPNYVSPLSLDILRLLPASRTVDGTVAGC